MTGGHLYCQKHAHQHAKHIPITQPCGRVTGAGKKLVVVDDPYKPVVSHCRICTQMAAARVVLGEDTTA